MDGDAAVGDETHAARRFLRAREAAIEDGEEGPFFRFLVTDVVPPPHLKDRLTTRLHSALSTRLAVWRP